MKILVLNVGSSSYKFSLYDLYSDEPVDSLWKASIEIQEEHSSLHVIIHFSQNNKIEEKFSSLDLEKAITRILISLWQGKDQVIAHLKEIKCIGHRIVHGGIEFDQPVIINENVKSRIFQLSSLAPLHNPKHLQGIKWMEKFFPEIPQVAVFDTAFHRTMPEIIKTYPVPLAWKEKGVQRYGFHGLSHQYCAERATSLLNKKSEDLKIINCHLGNGCSLCAIKEGKSYETTMGLSPLEGLMMGTRCGSIDPEILLYLQREYHFSVGELEHILNFESGLKGVCGFSDMREILYHQSQSVVCFGLDMFLHRLKYFIGALAASLEGFNVLSFTGGIGENAPFIREKICQSLAFLGIHIDLDKNNSCYSDEDIRLPSSNKHVIVITAREDWMIARACLNLQKANKI